VPSKLCKLCLTQFSADDKLRSESWVRHNLYNLCRLSCASCV
jgi:hypothetical protein